MLHSEQFVPSCTPGPGGVGPSSCCRRRLTAGSQEQLVSIEGRAVCVYVHSGHSRRGDDVGDGREAAEESGGTKRRDQGEKKRREWITRLSRNGSWVQMSQRATELLHARLWSTAAWNHCFQTVAETRVKEGRLTMTSRVVWRLIILKQNKTRVGERKGQQSPDLFASLCPYARTL